MAMRRRYQQHQAIYHAALKAKTEAFDNERKTAYTEAAEAQPERISTPQGAKELYDEVSARLVAEQSEQMFRDTLDFTIQALRLISARDKMSPDDVALLYRDDLCEIVALDELSECLVFFRRRLSA
jgi:hypothetical protein